MRIEKHVESLREVMDEIEKALEDERGLLVHQRRIALMLSMGICDLVEIYLQRLKVLKEGSRIKHTWFRGSGTKSRLSDQITGSIDSIKRIDEIIHLASGIEEKRDDLTYSSPLTSDKLLREKIDQFLDLKGIVEDETGGIIEK